MPFLTRGERPLFTREWVQLKSGEVVTPLEPLILAATLALIPVLILQADATGSWRTSAFAANWVIWAIFAVELVAVLYVADRKRAALRAHWLDVGVVVLTIPLWGELLSSLRFFRFLRLLRAIAIISRAIQAERRLTSGSTFRVVGLLTIFLIVVAGAAQATFEADEFPTLWDGVWWAVVTATTVGYGDLTPEGVGGRMIGMVVMLVGIGFISVLTATIASKFIETDTNSDEIIETLKRIETDVAELKSRLPAS